MKTTRWLVLVMLAVGVFLTFACGDDDDDDRSGMPNCEGGKLDPETDLCWQDPPASDSMDWYDAVTYCDELSLEGKGGWRLPMIQELVSLMRGCVDGTATGDLSTSECQVSDPDCLDWDCTDSGCEWCDASDGPDQNSEGCYWDPGLEGECSEVAYWSSSLSAEDVSYVWYFFFDWGGLSYHDKSNLHEVRCVRDE